MDTKTEKQLCNRAVAAHLRGLAGDVGEPMYPSSQYVTHKGLDYVVLGNIRGVLAVYRVRVVNGEPVLKGLKRWPAELNGAFGAN